MPVVAGAPRPGRRSGASSTCSTGGSPRPSSWRARNTIADIAVWPWYGSLAKGLLYGAAEFLAVHEYRNVNRWADAIGARPAVKRGRIVDRLQGDPKVQLRECHDASDFELRTEDKVGAKG